MESLLSRAVGALSAAALAQDTPETRSALLALHPRAPPPEIPSHSPVPLPVSPSAARRAIFGFAPGAAPGPDGLAPDVLRQLWSCLGPSLGEAVAPVLGLVAGGLVPPVVRPVLFGARLFALEKKGGGLRPIACGSVWRRAAAKLLAGGPGRVAGRALFSEGQVGVACPSGLDGASLALRLLLAAAPPDECTAAVQFDAANAFNTVCRGWLLAAVARLSPDASTSSASECGPASNTVTRPSALSSTPTPLMLRSTR